jgi:hypothetical protein
MTVSEALAVFDEGQDTYFSKSALIETLSSGSGIERTADPIIKRRKQKAADFRSGASISGFADIG